MQIYNQPPVHQWNGSSTVRSDAFWKLQSFWSSGPSTIIWQSPLHVRRERATNLRVIFLTLATEVRLSLFSRTYKVCSTSALLEMNLRNSSSLRFPLYLWKTIFLRCDLMHSTRELLPELGMVFSSAFSYRLKHHISKWCIREMDHARGNDLPLLINSGMGVK